MVEESRCIIARRQMCTVDSVMYTLYRLLSLLLYRCLMYRRQYSRPFLEFQQHQKQCAFAYLSTFFSDVCAGASSSGGGAIVGYDYADVTGKVNRERERLDLLLSL